VPLSPLLPREPHSVCGGGKWGTHEICLTESSYTKPFAEKQQKNKNKIQNISKLA
jgi:hypothetical protein